MTVPSPAPVAASLTTGVRVPPSVLAGSRRAALTSGVDEVEVVERDRAGVGQIRRVGVLGDRADAVGTR